MGHCVQYHAVAVVSSVLLRRPGFVPGSVHVGFVVHYDRFFSEFFGLPVSVSFRQSSSYCLGIILVFTV
jgi:hypothetical protein